MRELDDTSRHILRLMQSEPGLSNAAIAAATNLSAAACWRRVQRMEADGVIKGRAVRLDPRAVGFEVEVFLRITLDKTADNAFDTFIAAAKQIRHIRAIQTLLGRVDIRMDVVARDLAHYQEVYRNDILALPHILDIEALMLVSELKNTEAVPV